MARDAAALKLLAASLSLSEAEAFVRRSMACLAEELSGGGGPLGATSRIASVIKGEGAESPSLAFLIEYWQTEEKLGGDVREISPEEALAAPTRVEVSSLSVLLDLASGRLSPVVAMVQRRVRVAGDVALARPLAPALRCAVSRAAAEFHERPSDARSMQSSFYGSWMPNDASAGCVLCGRPWNPLLRLRHHCRTCGSLVCSRCSSCSQGRHSRKCLRCQAGARSFLVESFAPGPVGGSAPQAEPLPELPAGTETEGLLQAQIQAALAPKIQKKIEASPPSERERRLWDRVVAAEKRSLEAESQAGFGALAMLLSQRLLRLVFHGAFFCSTLFLGALSDERLQTSGSRFSSVTDQLYIFLLTLLIVLQDVRPARLSFVLPVLYLAVPLDGWTAWGDSALGSTLHRRPRLVVFCGSTALSVLYIRGLQSYRYFWRLTEIYVTAAFPIALYFCCRCVKKVLKLTDQQATEWMYDPSDRLVAPFLSNRFAALGGLFVKAGQWLANMAATPLVWTEHLKKLQDCAPKDQEAYVKALLEAEFGKSFQELFLEFDFDPVASASIAQVHKAVMSDTGQQVAVKLQHEGVEPMMLLDLDALRRVLAFSCWLGGRDWDEIKSITEGWMREMVHELDFHREVENLSEVRRGLKDAGVQVVVPSEVPGLVSRRAFAMEFCEGFRFTDLDQLALWGVDRHALSERAVHAMACQLLEIGVFNSDPHGGNLLCQVRGTEAVPVLLDFGNCIRLPEEQRLLYCELLVALSDASMSSVVQATTKLGIISSQTEAHPARDMEYMMMVFRDTGSRKSQIAGLKSFRELRKSQREADMEALDSETKKNKKKAKKQTERYPKKMPEEAVLFLRMMLLVRGLCSQLDAELPFLQLFEQHARRALAARHPRACRALRPLADDSSRCPQGALGAVLRELIGRLVVERPGLGVQAAVYVGTECVADEAGGVRGGTDPRPLLRSSKMPLADLSRLIWLLALLQYEREGKMKYSDRLSSFSFESSATVADALSHRAITEEHRELLMASSPVELHDTELMAQRVALALGPATTARYLPWGAGYVAAACLRQLRGRPLSGQELSLQGSSEATLCSGLFADLRSLASGSPTAGSGSIFMGAVLGGSPTKRPDATPKAPHKQSLARSVFDDAGGLLADVGLANVAAKWPAEVCPDLSCAASARGLAAVLAAACPVKDARPIHGHEGSPGAPSLLSQLAPPGRSWDERGLQVMELENSAVPAVGMGSCGGLLGYALQWPGSRPVTAVVLCNQLSMMTVPSQLLARVADALHLARPAALP